LHFFATFAIIHCIIKQYQPLMKPTFEAIPVFGQKSFLIRTFGEEGFEAPFHYHPEYELTYIVEGRGTRFIGTQMESFKDGDLVLVGSNVPHCWKLDKDCNEASSIVLQFKVDFPKQVGNTFHEGTAIRSFLEATQGAMVITRETRDSLSEYILKLHEEKDDFMALLRFFHLLNLISKSSENIFILTAPAISHKAASDKASIVPALEYIQNNFHQTIDLNTAAAIANLSPIAFCKKFKKHTRKTFMEVVIDYRINLGLKLLIETDLSIANVAENCGFGDVSNFFRAFKKRFATTPLQYRTLYKKSVLSPSDAVSKWPSFTNDTSDQGKAR